VAGDWIAFDKTLPQKPEVSRITRSLSISKAEAMLGCLLVWTWADDNTTDGTVELGQVEHEISQAAAQGRPTETARTQGPDRSVRTVVRFVSACEADKMRTTGQDRTGNNVLKREELRRSQNA